MNNFSFTYENKEDKVLSEFTPRMATDGNVYFLGDHIFLKGVKDKQKAKEEVGLLKKLSMHPCFPEVLHVFDEDGITFIKFRRMKGQLLSELFEQCGPFSLLDKMFIIDELWNAVQCLITQNIVHGCINENNLMFDAERKRLMVVGLSDMALECKIMNGSDIFGQTAGFYYMLDWLKIR